MTNSKPQIRCNHFLPKQKNTGQFEESTSHRIFHLTQKIADKALANTNLDIEALHSSPFSPVSFTDNKLSSTVPKQKERY